MIASHPILYGNCEITTTSWIKDSPMPDAILSGEEISPRFQRQEFLHNAPQSQDLSKFLPFVLYECSLTNVGKGVATQVEFQVKERFGDEPTLMDGSSSFTDARYEVITIPKLEPKASYTFLVANQNALTAFVQLGQSVSYHVQPGNEEVTEALQHDGFWNQLTVRNQGRSNPPAKRK